MTTKRIARTYRVQLDVDAAYDLQHHVDPRRVDAIGKSFTGEPLPPILVVEDIGNGYLVLDGHHRIELARQRGDATITAYVVRRDEFERIIEEEFGGDVPIRLSDLDDYILMEEAYYQR